MVHFFFRQWRSQGSFRRFVLNKVNQEMEEILSKGAVNKIIKGMKVPALRQLMKFVSCLWPVTDTKTWNRCYSALTWNYHSISCERWNLNGGGLSDFIQCLQDLRSGVGLSSAIHRAHRRQPRPTRRREARDRRRRLRHGRRLQWRNRHRHWSGSGLQQIGFPLSQRLLFQIKPIHVHHPLDPIIDWLLSCICSYCHTLSTLLTSTSYNSYPSTGFQSWCSLQPPQLANVSFLLSRSCQCLPLSHSYRFLFVRDDPILPQFQQNKHNYSLALNKFLPSPPSFWPSYRFRLGFKELFRSLEKLGGATTYEIAATQAWKEKPNKIQIQWRLKTKHKMPASSFITSRYVVPDSLFRTSNKKKREKK